MAHKGKSALKKLPVLVASGLLGSGKVTKGVLILGHSKARGNSTAFGPNPSPYASQFNAGTGTIVQVGSTDLIEANASGGSEWPSFALSLAAANGWYTQFCDNGIGGSAYRYDLDGTLSWYTTGTLWAASVIKARNWLNLVGAIDPDLVIIVLGINDANKTPFTTTYADITNLINRINTEYHSPRIIVCQESCVFSTFLTTWQLQFNLLQIRKWQKKLSVDYANVEVMFCEPQLQGWITTPYQGDGVHLTYDGNLFLGSRLARLYALSTSIHKSARMWIASDYFLPTAQQAAWLNDLAVALDTAGLLNELDSLKIATTEGVVDFGNDYKNAYKDLALLAQGSATAPTAMVKYDGTLGDGVDDQWVEGIYSQIEDKCLFASDFIAGIYIVQNLDAAGVLGAAFGTRENAATGIVYLGQTAASLIEYCACDGVVDTDGTDTKFQDNTWYHVARSGGNKLLIKNSTTIKTVARAAIALGPAGNIRASRYLSYNNNGTVTNFANMKFAVSYVAKYSTWNVANFVSIMNSFLSNWLSSANVLSIVTRSSDDLALKDAQHYNHVGQDDAGRIAYEYFKNYTQE